MTSGDSDCRFTARDGTILSAWTQEPDRGPRGAICIVHGLGEHSRRHSRWASRLAKAGFAVMAFDMRGHGDSPGRRGDAPSCLALLSDIDIMLEKAVERYPGIPLFLLGHSFGGSLVIGYATGARPGTLRGVVALSPLLRPTNAPPGWKRAAALMLSRMVPGLTMSTGLESKALSRCTETIEEYDRDPLVHDRVSARLGMDILRFGQGSIAEASGLELPMLLMHGGDDSVTSPDASREFAAAAGDVCRLIIWDGLYHELHNEPEREQVFACLLEWLEERMEED